jgi:hypothetical protein
MFELYIKPEDPLKWRALVLNGYNSYITPEFIEICFLYRIYFVFLLLYFFYVL